MARAITSSQVTKVELQSILGRLNFALRVMPQGRAFISRLLSLLPSASEPSSIVHLDRAAMADLRMWDSFLLSWNGVSLFVPSWSQSSTRVFADAAASRGFAAIFGSQWLAGPWPPQVSSDPQSLSSSPFLECYPIVAAASVWGHLWANSSVMFVSDSQDLVDIISKGRAKSARVMSLLRKLVWLAMTHNFHFSCSHIPGTSNTAADALSRFNFHTFFQVCPEADRTGARIPGFSDLMLD